MLRNVSAPQERFLAPRMLVFGQSALPLIYFLGVAVPYLFLFTFKGTDHCPPGLGCQAPGDALPGWAVWLWAPMLLAVILGPLIAVLMLLGSFTSLARRRRRMPAGLRRWLVYSSWATAAFLVFTLLPPGRLFLNWVLD